MKRKHTLMYVGGLLCAALLLTSCETVPRGAGLGGAIGAGAGAIIGHQSGHALEGAAIGGLVGAAAGAIASDIRARRARTAQETAQTYNYQPAQGEMLKLEEVNVLPSQVKRGNMVESTLQYALLGAGSGVAVRESRVLRRGGEVIAEVSSQSFTRDDGTWLSAQQFKVLDAWQPGEYSLTTSVETAKSRVSGAANFAIVE